MKPSLVTLIIFILISISDLALSQPANIGIAAKEFSNVLGSTLKKPLLQWDFLRLEDLE